MTAVDTEILVDVWQRLLADPHKSWALFENGTCVVLTAPEGDLAEQATELLASERMAQVLQRLETRDPRRIVLIDSPPILLSSEARVLLNIMGQVVFVVRAGVTPKAAVLEALNQIDEGRYVGLILNQSEAAQASAYYGYGYGYGAAYGAERDPGTGTGKK